MTFEEYVATLPTGLSEVKEKILQRLWTEGNKFPRGWVASSELLALTGQKYFDRRARELRDEMGCDIETGHSGGEHAYRLQSTKLDSAKPRGYLAGRQKADLFEKAGFRCAVCGLVFKSGLRGLQADHKIPLNRGGQQEDGNWQPLCVECNVAKRRACADCLDDCNTCIWAFPERSVRRVVVPVTEKTEALLRKYAELTGRTIEAVAAEALNQYRA